MLLTVETSRAKIFYCFDINKFDYYSIIICVMSDIHDSELTNTLTGIHNVLLCHICLRYKQVV